MTLTELNSIRCNKMHELLNEEGCRNIWQYDVIPIKQALREAIYNQDYDNMQTDSNKEYQYCLIGGGICDSPFNTVEELNHIIEWLCGEGGYLGCYSKTS